MPLTVGSRLGHYDVTALIGEGGMGQVYRARALSRTFTLYVVKPTETNEPGWQERLLAG